MTIAFVFPGQGSWEQDVLEPWREHPAAEVIEEVGSRAGLDLWSLPADTGGRTALAQPAILGASLATHRALRDAGVTPDVVAGHSLGEVTAAVAAGSLTLGDGAALVAERGRAFASACAATPGTMAAVLRLDEPEVRGLLEEIDDDAQVANLNAPGQVVVSGTGEAVARIRERAGERGGRALPLDVEGAFHSAAMSPAMVCVDLMLRRLTVKDPEITFVTGTTGRTIVSAHAVRRALVDGVLAPVRWVDVQRRLAGLGVEHVVEVGPGSVLAGLARRTVPDLPVTSVASPEEVRDLAEDLAGRGLLDATGSTHTPATIGARR